jgi:hypothetical protein
MLTLDAHGFRVILQRLYQHRMKVNPGRNPRIHGGSRLVILMFFLRRLEGFKILQS